ENAIAVRGRESEDNIGIPIRALHRDDFARCDPLGAVGIIDRERDWKTEGLIGPVEPRLEADVIDVVKAREPKGDPLRGACAGMSEAAPDCAGDAIERSRKWPTVQGRRGLVACDGRLLSLRGRADQQTGQDADCKKSPRCGLFSTRK